MNDNFMGLDARVVDCPRCIEEAAARGASSSALLGAAG